MAREIKLAGLFFLALGACGVLASMWELFTGNITFMQGTSCKALCGIGSIVGQVFGPSAGAAATAGLLLCVSLGFTYVGHRTLRDR